MQFRRGCKLGEVAMSREVRKRRDEYLLTSLDPNFLLGDSTRGIRFFLEYEKPEERHRRRSRNYGGCQQGCGRFWYPRPVGPALPPKRHTRTIVGRSSSAVEHEFAEARIAWKRYRSTRERDAVYDYLRLIINVSQGGRGETEKAIMCS